MSNTVYGPYAPTTWVDNVTLGNQTRMNNLETQASDALHGFNGDLLTPFVLSGVTSARNGTTLNQLDVTSGSAYVKFADNTIGLVSVVASTAGQFTTSTPSTTYYLFLKNDGTWQWGTTSTGPTNSLAICQATTDGSGNILVVTDRRTLSTTLLAAASAPVNTPGLTTGGNVVLNGNYFLQKAWSGTGSGWAWLLQALPNSLPVNKTWEMSYNGGSGEIQFYNDTDSQMPLSLGPGTTGNTAIGNAGNLAKIAGQATAGPFGVPVIVGSLKDQIANSAAVFNYTLVASVPATGLYRITAQFYLAAGTTRKILLSLSFTQGHSGNATSRAFVSEFSTGGLLWDGTAGGDGASAGDALGAVMVVYLQVGTVLTLRFQDANWTSGNNLVGGVCERMF